MSVTIIDRHWSDGSDFNVRFRTARVGPEHEFVSSFLQHANIKAPRGCQVTIFREPRIESGFPDLVVVAWHKATAEQWHPLRAQLTRDDIRLMHYLAHSGQVAISDLTPIFGKKVSQSLDRLEAARMLRRGRKTWTARPLSMIYAARHIIAIEAKITQWQSAIDQAHLNTVTVQGG